MKIAFFSAKGFERKVFDQVVSSGHFDFGINYFDVRLNRESAALARGSAVVCVFVSDQLEGDVIRDLALHGLKLLALRSAGFNHVDVDVCRECKVTVVRVPAYSPYAVAEHTLCLLLALNRKIHRAYQRVRELNFSLDGLVGFDVHGKTVGVIGTGKIGRLFARSVTGLGAKVVAFDPAPHADLLAMEGARYASLEELLKQSDIISLHCPLTSATTHVIDHDQIEIMKKGVLILNTSRGGLINTAALIEGLKSGQVGAAGLDVYEEEEGIFFSDLSQGVLQDDVLARLLSFPNVLITAHQGFLTQEALQNIATTTIGNIKNFFSDSLADDVVVVRA
jgi:D-lactate dehydrogenase